MNSDYQWYKSLQDAGFKHQMENLGRTLVAMEWSKLLDKRETAQLYSRRGRLLSVLITQTCSGRCGGMEDQTKGIHFRDF